MIGSLAALIASILAQILSLFPAPHPSSTATPHVRYEITQCSVDPKHPKEEVDMTVQVTAYTSDPVDFTAEPALLISGVDKSFSGGLDLSLSPGQTASVSTQILTDSIPSPLVCDITGASYYDPVTGRNY